MADALDYPSQLRAPYQPPWPFLLDTCTLRHLHFVLRETGEDWEIGADVATALEESFGARFALEVIALNDLVVFYQGQPPWMVSATSLHELERTNVAPGMRSELLRWWSEWAAYGLETTWEASAPDPRELLPRQSAAHPGQLRLALGKTAERVSFPPPFRPFRDRGDCSLVREALRAGVAGILTTDIRSFWRHRRSLYPLGVEVWRPSDLLKTLTRRQTRVAA